MEADLAVKAEEAASLKLQNRQLTEENTRLTDLTRMLLSSKAFAGFLQELGNSAPNSVAPLAQQKQQHRQQPLQSQPQPQSQNHLKDVPVYEATRQLQNTDQNMQVGMTLIPDTPLDMSMFDGGYNTFIPTQDFTVFSMMEIPVPPTVDMSVVCGKKSSDLGRVSKQDAPTLVATGTEELPEHIVVDGDDLYSELESTNIKTALEMPERLTLQIGKTELAAALQQLESSTSRDGSHVSESNSLVGLEQVLDEWCQSLDESCARLRRYLP